MENRIRESAPRPSPNCQRSCQASCLPTDRPIIRPSVKPLLTMRCPNSECSRQYCSSRWMRRRIASRGADTRRCRLPSPSGARRGRRSDRPRIPRSKVPASKFPLSEVSAEVGDSAVVVELKDGHLEASISCRGVTSPQSESRAASRLSRIHWNTMVAPNTLDKKD